MLSQWQIFVSMAGSVLCFSCWGAAMGISRWFFVETKSFEFAMEEGVLVSRVIKGVGHYALYSHG